MLYYFYVDQNYMFIFILIRLSGRRYNIYLFDFDFIQENWKKRAENKTKSLIFSFGVKLLKNKSPFYFESNITHLFIMIINLIG